jgi:peptidoglycan hydrolase-like protein with peptidoglycan-binding domain
VGIIKVKNYSLYMSKSTRKIVAGLLSIAMVLTLVVGLSATASAQTAAFTRNLTVGSTGADVTALQTWLATKGFFTVTPTGYFGSITRRAVAQYQASVGISPAAGYFGPITRAYIATQGGVTMPPTGSVPGCPAGAIYNYMTGALCSTTTPSTSTTEGTLSVQQSAQPANNANVTTNSDVKVYGLDLKAQLADVTVSRVDLDVSVYTSGPSYENPGNFINTIKVMSGDTVVKSWAVGTADFVQGTSSNQYYVRLSNIGFVVPKDTTKNLTVSFSTNGGIDSDRNVVVKGYGTNSLLAISGNNINSYYDVSSISRTHVFKKPGTSTLTVSADSSNPFSTTYRVNTTDSGALNSTMLKFAAKSDTGDSKITSVTVLATSSNTTGPTALYLYDGSTLIASQSVSSWSAATAKTVTFSNINVTVPKDTTKVLTVSGDFGASTSNGTIASTTVSSVSYQKPNGNSATLSPNVQGNNMYFYSASAYLQFLSGTASVNPSINNQPSGVSGKFTLKVKPVGGSMTLPTANDFVVNVASSSSSMAIDTGSTVAARAGSQSVTVEGNPSVLSENVEYTITLDAVVASTTLSSGSYPVWFTMTGATTTVNSVAVNQTWGLNNFRTGSVTWTE